MINAPLARARETDYCVFALIALALEVQVVCDGMFPTLVNGCETNNHIEFTPASLLYTKGWAFEGCIENLGQPICPKYLNMSASHTLDRSICKGLVQFVGYFLEASSGDLFPTCRMYDIYLYVP